MLNIPQKFSNNRRHEIEQAELAFCKDDVPTDTILDVRSINRLLWNLFRESEAFVAHGEVFSAFENLCSASAVIEAAACWQRRSNFECRLLSCRNDNLAMV